MQVFNLDLIPSLNIECVYHFDFIVSLYFTTAWPIVLCILLLTVAPYITSRLRNVTFAQAASAYLTVPYTY